MAVQVHELDANLDDIRWPLHFLIDTFDYICNNPFWMNSVFWNGDHINVDNKITKLLFSILLRKYRFFWIDKKLPNKKFSASARSKGFKCAEHHKIHHDIISRYEDTVNYKSLQISWLFKCQPHKMVKHKQFVGKLPTNCLSVWPFCGVSA